MLLTALRKKNNSVSKSLNNDVWNYLIINGQFLKGVVRLLTLFFIVLRVL